MSRIRLINMRRADVQPEGAALYRIQYNSTGRQL
jgi:hypothetical protein